MCICVRLLQPCRLRLAYPSGKFSHVGLPNQVEWWKVTTTLSLVYPSRDPQAPFTELRGRLRTTPLAKSYGPGIEVIPSARRLVKSLRDLGYDFVHAVADLIDNSIAAGASEAAVTMQFDGPDSWVRISDNGSGMTGTTITEPPSPRGALRRCWTGWRSLNEAGYTTAWFPEHHLVQ
jgi:hypothetical protein